MWIGLILLAIGCPDQGDESLIEILRDAQATHRVRWSRGKSDLRVEIQNRAVATPAVLQGEVTWTDSSFVLKYKATDPEGAFFRNRAVGLDLEWNYVAKTPEFVITYLARNNVLNDRKAGPRAVEPYYELSPFAAFSNCCAPALHAARPWDRLIGPIASPPEALKASRFEYKKLTNGDFEQTRRDQGGESVVILFSAADEFAVRSLVEHDSRGRAMRTITYTYGRDSGKRLIPSTCTVEEPNPSSKISSWKYIYTKVNIASSVSAADFRRDSIMNLIRRTTPYGKSASQRVNRETSDEVLDSLSKELKGGTPKPK